MSYYLNLVIQSKLPTVAALVILLAATLIGWYWVWGVLFLYWAVIGIVTRRAFIVQTVQQDDSPVLFWLISVTWVLLAILTILYDIFPDTVRLWLGDGNA